MEEEANHPFCKVIAVDVAVPHGGDRCDSEVERSDVELPRGEILEFSSFYPRHLLVRIINIVLVKLLCSKNPYTGNEMAHKKQNKEKVDQLLNSCPDVQFGPKLLEVLDRVALHELENSQQPRDLDKLVKFRNPRYPYEPIVLGWVHLRSLIRQISCLF